MSSAIFSYPLSFIIFLPITATGILADQKYDAAGLKKRLERMEKKAARRSHQNITYTFLLREYGRYERNSVNAILDRHIAYSGTVLYHAFTHIFYVANVQIHMFP